MSRFSSVRTRLLGSLVCSCVLGVAAPASWAQDDPFAVDAAPFGDAAAPFGEGAAPFGGDGAPVPTGPGSRETDATVLEIQRRASAGTAGLVTAVRLAAQVGRWDLAGEYVADLVAQGLSPRQSAAAAEIVGGRLLRQLRQREELDEAQRQAVATLQTAAAAYARDPGRMATMVTQLTDASAEKRASAVRQLATGGRPAVKALVEELSTGSAGIPRDTLVRMLAPFEAVGTEAVRQIALYGASDARRNAIAALAELEGRGAMADLLAELYAFPADQTARRAAAGRVEALLGGVPGYAETQAYLARQLEAAKRLWRQSSADQTAVLEAWFVAADGRSVESRWLSAADVAARHMLDAAERLRRVSGADSQPLDSALAAELAYRLAADEDAGFGGPDENLAARWEDRGGLTAARLERVLRTAREEELPGAAIVALRMLEASGDTMLLQGSGGEPSPLVAAALARQPRVRLEAAAAIAVLEPERAFAGSSEVVRLWHQMRRLPDRPTAIVVEPQAALRGMLETWLMELGYEVRHVPTARALLEAASETAELEVVLLADRLPDMPTVEALDRLRRATGGGDVLALVYGSDLRTESLLPADPLAARIARPQSRQRLARVLQDLEAGRAAGRVTAADRARFRHLATAVLEAAETRPERYGWFHRYGSLRPLTRAAAREPLAGSTEG